jgi:homoserine dehydrogenase
LRADDPLARVDGTANAVVCKASPLGEITITGPGAGPELAGQGVLSDLIAVTGLMQSARSGSGTRTGEA